MITERAIKINNSSLDCKEMIDMTDMTEMTLSEFIASHKKIEDNSNENFLNKKRKCNDIEMIEEE